MLKTYHLLGIIVFTLSQLWTVSSKCNETRGLTGMINEEPFVRYNTVYEKCWTIKAPTNKYIKLFIKRTDFDSFSCDYAYVKIKLQETNQNFTYCHNDTNRNQPITALSNVDVHFHFDARRGFSVKPALQFNYTIQDIECVKNGGFLCSNFTCIPRSQVCDGVKNCENGEDEKGCETGIEGISGIPEARLRAIDWLISKRTPSWGWKENTPRAVTALFLADGASFNGTNLKEELMAKNTELKTSIAFLKDSLPLEQLSMFINGLLVTCYNPRHFYGHNLVKRLKDQVKTSNDSVHPIVYLTLCNAKESWPERAFTDIKKILNSNSEYPFFKDIQAFSIMAVSCYENNTENFNHTNISELKLLSKKLIAHFKEHQLFDGSFGNAQSTAVITQALFASGHKHAKDWKLNATMKYLIKELNSSHIDFLDNYLTLPLLNGKSLADIAKVNCLANPRRHGDEDVVSEINDYTGPMVRIQYSLYVGDDRDVIHTISLRVPENFTAYEVMKAAEVEDHKYKFEWKKISGKMYVYKIGKVSNDPEAGKFWLLYLGSTPTNITENSLTHSTKSPDQLTLTENHHLVMWYKQAYV